LVVGLWKVDFVRRADVLSDGMLDIAAKHPVYIEKGA
jgi:hypothetical protein